LLAFDLPGHGDSQVASDLSDYAILSMSKRVAEFIDQKQLKDVVVVAHSLGGHLAIHALRFTNQVKGIMLIGASPLENATGLSNGYNLSEDIMAFFKKEASDEELSKALELEVYHKKYHPIIQDSYSKTDGRSREVLAVELGTTSSSPVSLRRVM